MFQDHRRTLNTNVLVLALVVLGLGHLSGVFKGAAGGSPERGSGTHVEKAPTSRPRPSCFAGSVWLAPRAGAIDFRAHCRATAPSGDINVAVSRTTPDELQFLPIQAFRHFPFLKDKNGARRGRCLRARRSSNGEILCSAKVKRSAVVEGRIWIAPEERCEAFIQMASSPSHKPCKEVCGQVLPASTLIVRGRPRGC